MIDGSARMHPRTEMIDGLDDILDRDGILGSEWIIGSGYGDLHAANMN